MSLLRCCDRDAPNYGLYFVTYDVVKHALAPGEIDAVSKLRAPSTKGAYT
jgi:hypothetical protein